MKKFEKEMAKDKFINSFWGGLIITVAAIAIFMLLISGIMTLIFGLYEHLFENQGYWDIRICPHKIIWKDMGSTGK